MLSACQSTQTIKPVPVDSQVTIPLKFAITGKIGIISQTTNGKTGSSAFYAWHQEGQRFGIDLTGALGIGATQIRFDGKTATLHSENTGTIQASNPEELLYTATGWQAPISELPYWILGMAAPSDTNYTKDADGKIQTATNADWTASFDYGSKKLPSRIQVIHTQGHKVTLTIDHQ